jgi:membrane protein YqaA with SNARE-associated domain
MVIMGWRLARGIGEFVLFLVLYTVVGSVVGTLITYMIASRFFSAPSEGSILVVIFYLCAAALGGFFGVTLGSSAFNMIMKRHPARWVGGALILWLVAQYALHFIFFPENTDDAVYYGLIQSTVGCVTAWFVFRLPPLTPMRNKDFKSGS